MGTSAVPIEGGCGRAGKAGTGDGNRREPGSGWQLCGECVERERAAAAGAPAPRSPLAIRIEERIVARPD